MSVEKVSSTVSQKRGLPQHEPTLVRLNDGRWEVRCTECATGSAEAMPIGIGLPVANQVEAEWIVRNHGGVLKRTQVA